MSSRRPSAHVAWLAAAVVLLAGCGGESTDPTSTTSSASAPTVPEAEKVSSGPCEAPPELPSDVPSYAEDDAPTGKAVPARSTAVLRTTCGDLTVELFGEEAPDTVASFLFLSREGYWADSPCHRLTTTGIFVLQCGDPTGTGRGGPGYTFGVENAPTDGHYPRGTLAMARAQDPNSNGGQFFIVYDDSRLPVEGGGYTVFGRVTDGMEIVDRVADAGVDGGGQDGIPAQPISIRSVAVEEEAAQS